MDYEDLAMESAIWPWIDDDLAGMELEPWDDYEDQIIECGTSGNVGPWCPSSSNNDRDGAGPVARSYKSLLTNGNADLSGKFY